MPNIFISYRRSDDPYATHHVRDRLVDRYGPQSVFMDIDSIPIGVDFVEYLDAQVGKCDILLAIIGERWLDACLQDGQRRLDDPNDFVRIEIQSALTRGIPVVPVLVGRATMPLVDDLPEGLKPLVRRNAAEVRPGSDLKQHLDRLVQGIDLLFPQMPSVPSHPPKTERGRQNLPREVVNFIGMKFMLIPAGTFLMGSPKDEKGRREDEGPQHEVEITRPFYLGAYQVTQKQWQQVMGKNPSRFCGTNSPDDDRVKGVDTSYFPVECVSWEDVRGFLEKLAALPEEVNAGRTYRLPTEAEWEYACRGGASSYQVFHYGNSLSSTQANFNGNYPYGKVVKGLFSTRSEAVKGPFLSRTCKVGSYPPNAFGLYDMHGNVWEWCADWYDEDYYKSSPRCDPVGPAEGSMRVCRGGGWDYDATICRSAKRLMRRPDVRGVYLGFRAVLVLKEPLRGQAG